MRPTLLVTGAGGMIGRDLIPRLQADYPTRACDRAPVEGLEAEDFRIADLGDLAALRQAARGCGAIIHLGAESWENDFERVMVPSNIVGPYNLLEAARMEGVRRVLFASTHHTVGCYHPNENPLLETVELRPDTFYAATKLWGEALCRLYREKHGIAFVCARIGFFLTKKRIREGKSEAKACLGLTPADFHRFVRRFLEAENLGFAILNCASRCAKPWLDLAAAARRIGYTPSDDVDRFFELEWRRLGLA